MLDGAFAEKKLPDKLHNRVVAAGVGFMLEAFPEFSKEAMAYFRKNVTDDYGSGGNEKALINTWLAAFKEQGSVADRPRSGRSTLITDEHAAELALLLLQGYYLKFKKKWLWRGFSGLKDAINNTRHGGHIRNIMAQYDSDIDVDSVMRRINEVVPWLRKHKLKVDYKMEHTPENTKERLVVARELQHAHIDEHNAVISLDAKKVYINPEKYTAVYNMDKSLVVEDARISTNSKDGYVLYYYAAVNALLGVVLFRWVTGTSELNRGYKTKVWPRTVTAHLPMNINSTLTIQAKSSSGDMHHCKPDLYSLFWCSGCALLILEIT